MHSENIYYNTTFSTLAYQPAHAKKLTASLQAVIHCGMLHECQVTHYKCLHIAKTPVGAVHVQGTL